MAQQELVVVAGLGEVGRPLLHILSRTFACAGIDIEPVTIEARCSALHICYPFQIAGYITITENYIRSLRPSLTIIHSTVPPGTTRKIQNDIGEVKVAYSPVRGKHARMEQDLQRYRKFVAAPNPDALRLALDHLREAGFRTRTMPSPELAELSKLLETTYLGMMIAWTQEMERLAAQYSGTFSDVNRFIEEIEFLPSQTFPGAIGGHCVLPNIDLLRSRVKSEFLDLIVKSNQLKAQVPVTSGAGVHHGQNRTDRIGILGA